MKNLIDQILHILWSAVAILPVLIEPTLFTGLLSGFLVGAPRELVDQMTLNEWKNFKFNAHWQKYFEMLMFAVGGMLAVLVI